MNVFNKSVFLENPNQIYKSKNYGDFVVTVYTNAVTVEIMFVATQSRSTVQASDLRKGDVKDRSVPTILGVGYLGVGPHKSKLKRKNTKAYTAWTNMLKRCYCSSYHSKFPTYIGCSVCEEWLNFQNFAEWFYDNYVKGYDLDKDIVKKGNKIYCPAYCSYVTKSDNYVEAHAKYYKFNDPDGLLHEIYNLSEFCRLNNLVQGCMSSVYLDKHSQHKGWTKA